MDKIKKHQELSVSNHQNYIKKNSDYGDSFGKSFKEFGIISAIVRIGDKYNRLVSLCKEPTTPKVKDESITDTLMDLANYCLMTVIELENNDE